jgi:hypothetical protein
MSIILSGIFGQINNVVMGTTGSPTPPSGGDPYWSNVSLLLNNTSTNNANNNVFLDSSTNNITITKGAATTITQGSFTPYDVATNTSYNTSTNGGSVYFPGAASGNFLGLPITSVLQFGNGDFTIEAWVYTTSTATQCLIGGQSDLNTNAGSSWVFHIGGAISSDVYVGGTSYTITSPVPTINTWAHVAFVRNGTSFKSYLNGTEVGSTTLPSEATVNNGSTTYAPSVGGFRTNIRAFSGFISNLRVVKGTAVYTGNFTPPTSPVTAISGTSLLLNFTNAGMYDATTNNNFGTSGNSASVSTIAAKFGTASIRFTSSSSQTIRPFSSSSTNFQFGTDSFTVEFWINFASTTGTQIIYSSDATTAPNLQILKQPTTNNIRVYMNGMAIQLNDSSAITSNIWYHFAVVRDVNNGNSVTLYRDGVAVATTAYSGNVGSTVNNTIIGASNPIGPTNYLNAYLQDLRITKGVARYTSNFTPPTEPFPTY